MFTWWNTMVEDVKAFFLKSWSLFLARLEMVTGFIVGVVGGIDWDSLINLDWSDLVASKNAIIVGIIILLKGIVSEVGRRAGTVVTATNQLVPVNIASKAELPLKK